MTEMKWLVGTKRLEPVTYWLEEKIIKRRFWFYKKEYYVVCEFCKIGPMSLTVAKEQLSVANHV